jgi:hypothetical protein
LSLSPNRHGLHGVGARRAYMDIGTLAAVGSVFPATRHSMTRMLLAVCGLGEVGSPPVSLRGQLIRLWPHPYKLHITNPIGGASY